MVVLGEAVPQHQPRAVGGGAVEDAAVWPISSAEANGNDAASASVSKLRRWPRASTPTGRVVRPALQGAPGGRLGVEQHRGAHRPHPGALGVERLLVAGVDGEVQPDPEQLLLAPGQPGGQLAGVVGGDLDLGIGQASLGGIGAPARIRAGPAGGAAGRRRSRPGRARRAGPRRGGWGGR